MTLDRARWDKGMTYDAFKAAMTRNQERFAENETSRRRSTRRRCGPSRACRKPLRVLVLAEDWCGDVVANLPILGRISEGTAGARCPHLPTATRTSI